MRRKDREVMDNAKILSIISKCHCCRLGFCEDGRAYIVPLNFGYTQEGGRLTFYFHSAREGRKIDLIRKTGYAVFELDTNYELHPAETACEYSAGFQSIMGGGPVSFVEDPAEKRAALRALMDHNAGPRDWEFSDAMLHSVCVFKLEAEELSCKVHL